MAKKVENAKFLEVIKVLDLNQTIVLIDVSDSKNEITRTIKDLVYGTELERFRSDDEIEKMSIKDNKLYVYVDIIKGRTIERNSGRR